MEFIKPGIALDFIGKRKIAFVFSSIMIIVTIITLFWRGGPNFGVDFSGGVLIQVKLENEHAPSELKSALEPIQLQDSLIQGFGEEGEFEYLIRVRKMDIELAGLGDKVKEALVDKLGPGVEMRRVEMVGPKVGKDLRQKALFAIFYAILFIAIYISGRFELKWMMSIVMALSLALVVYVAPREIIASIPGMELVEMERNRENAVCCGISCWANCSSYSKQMQMDRLKEAEATGADTLITACPKCNIHFSCALSSTEMELEVKDLTQLMASAMDV